MLILWPTIPDYPCHVYSEHLQPIAQSVHVEMPEAPILEWFVVRLASHCVCLSASRPGCGRGCGSQSAVVAISPRGIKGRARLGWAGASVRSLGCGGAFLATVSPQTHVCPSWQGLVSAAALSANLYSRQTESNTQHPLPAWPVGFIGRYRFLTCQDTCTGCKGAMVWSHKDFSI